MFPPPLASTSTRNLNLRPVGPRTATKDLRRLWWLPVLCFGAAFGLGRTTFVRQFEWHTLDWRIEYRALFQRPPDPRIAVVLYEDSTDQNIAAWPPNRAWHGNFNEFISLDNPAVVAWDVLFDLSRKDGGDEKMAEGTQAAMARGPRFVFGAVTTPDRSDSAPGPIGPTEPFTHVEGDIARLTGGANALIPFPALRAICPFGFVNAPRASDGIIRDVPFVVRWDGKVYPSLSLQTILTYFRVPAAKVTVRLGDAVIVPTAKGVLRIPISDRGYYWVNYRYRQADCPTYSYAAILLLNNAYYVRRTPHAPRPPDLTGKIVFVGETVTGKADAGPTPRSAYAPLVMVHANIVDNILRHDYLRRVPAPVLWLGALLAGLVGLLLAERSVFVLCGGTVLVAVAYLAAAVEGFNLASLWLPVAAPLGGFGLQQFAIIGRRVFLEQKAKQEVKGMFGTYVSPQLVEQLVRSGERPQLGGHLAEITAYFSDIQGFSTFSEQLPADRLVELMNEYLTACTDIVLEEGGSLDKYIGDAIVAMFGAPVALADHALRACVASQRIQQRQAELRAKWAAEGERWPAVAAAMRTRIGLNTGRSVVGNMGSRTRFNYTMMGDDVNLAARMESGAKSWGVYTMCTEATKAACGPQGQERLVFRPLGRIVVKGRTQPVPIHEIVGLQEAVSDRTHECIGRFTEGLERYYARDWDGALERFCRSAALEPNAPGREAGVTSNPSLVYQAIVERCRADPPPADWGGVQVMRQK